MANLDLLSTLYPHIASIISPVQVFKNSVVKENIKGQEWALIRLYDDALISIYQALPTTAKMQILVNAKNDDGARKLAYTLFEKISENFNLTFNDSGVLDENGDNTIASIRCITKPISIGLVAGGGYQYSLNYEIRY